MMESFADHVGVRNGVAANTCRMAGGVGGRLAEGSVAFHGEHFVAAGGGGVVRKGGGNPCGPLYAH